MIYFIYPWFFFSMGSEKNNTFFPPMLEFIFIYSGVCGNWGLPAEVTVTLVVAYIIYGGGKKASEKIRDIPGTGKPNPCL